MFRDGQADGEYRDFDDELMSIALMSTLQLVPGEPLTEPSRTEAYAAEVADLFVRAVSPTAER
jgi:hypothetical protein